MFWPRRDRKDYYKTTTNRGKDDYDSENSWISDGLGSPAAAEEGGEAMGGGRGESGESSEVHERPSVTSTAPKARSRSIGVATLDDAPRMSEFENVFGECLPLDIGVCLPHCLLALLKMVLKTHSILQFQIQFFSSSSSSSISFLLSTTATKLSNSMQAILVCVFLCRHCQYSFKSKKIL